MNTDTEKGKDSTGLIVCLCVHLWLCLLHRLTAIRAADVPCPYFAPAFSPPRKSLEDICSERSSSENGVSMYRFWKHVYRGHPVYRLPGYRYFAPPGKAGQMSSGEGLREFREVSQGEFHEGVRAVQVELLTDVAAMRFDGVVTDE